MTNPNSPHLKKIVEIFSYSYKYIFFPEKNDLTNVNRLLDIVLLLGFIFQFSILTIEAFYLFLGYLTFLLLIEWKSLLSYSETDYSIRYQYLKIFNKLLFFIMVISTFTNVFNLFYVIQIDQKLLPKEFYFIGYIVVQNSLLIIIFLFVMLKTKSFFTKQKEINNEFSNKINIYMRNKLQLYNMKMQMNEEVVYVSGNNQERKVIENDSDNNENEEKNQVVQEVSMPVAGDGEDN